MTPPAKLTYATLGDKEEEMIEKESYLRGTVLSLFSRLREKCDNKVHRQDKKVFCSR